MSGLNSNGCRWISAARLPSSFDSACCRLASPTAHHGQATSETKSMRSGEDLFMALEPVWICTDVEAFKRMSTARAFNRSVPGAQHLFGVDDLHVRHLAEDLVEPRLVGGADNHQHARPGTFAEGRHDVGCHAQVARLPADDVHVAVVRRHAVAQRGAHVGFDGRLLRGRLIEQAIQGHDLVVREQIMLAVAHWLDTWATRVPGLANGGCKGLVL